MTPWGVKTSIWNTWEESVLSIKKLDDSIAEKTKEMRPPCLWGIFELIPHKQRRWSSLFLQPKWQGKWIKIKITAIMQKRKRQPHILENSIQLHDRLGPFASWRVWQSGRNGYSWDPKSHHYNGVKCFFLPRVIIRRIRDIYSWPNSKKY